MDVLVTGGNGQLGSCLKDVIAGSKDISASFIDINDLNLGDSEAVEKYFTNHRPNVIINCAAYTAVDNAEEDIASAGYVNVGAVENLANEAKKHNIKIIHISTDYVFDGQKKEPYSETDTPNPKTVYGYTKYKGEQVLSYLCPDAVIIRTAWLYSEYGKNFYLTMKTQAENNMEVKVVADQYGSPTYAGDLAQALSAIVTRSLWIPGIYHFTNRGETNWYEFAKEIYCLSGSDISLVKPISSTEFGAKAPRPHYSVLDSSKIRRTFNIDIPTWQQSLTTIIKK